MAFNFVQVKTGNTGTSTTTGSLATMTMTITAGDQLISVFGYPASRNGPTAMTDSLGNTWVAGLRNTGNTVWCYLANDVVGGTATITVSGSGTQASLGAWLIAEYTPVGNTLLYENQTFGMGVEGGPTFTSYIYIYPPAPVTVLDIMTVSLNTATSSVAWSVSTGSARGTATYSSMSLFWSDYRPSNPTGQNFYTTTSGTSTSTLAWLNFNGLTTVSYPTYQTDWVGGFGG